MKTRNSLYFAVIFSTIVVTLLLSAALAVVAVSWSDTAIDRTTEEVTIVETFYTTDGTGKSNYYIMWENDYTGDIFKVCSACYTRYRDAATMPIEVIEVESATKHGYDFVVHHHYNYYREDK